MDYFLQKVGGKSARQAVTLRRCTPAEAPAVFALQNEVRAAVHWRVAAGAAGGVPHPAPVRAER